MLPFSFYKPYINKLFSGAKIAFLLLIVYGLILTVFYRTISNERPKVNPQNGIEKTRAMIYKEINNPEYQKSTSGKISVLLFRTSTCAFMGEGCTDNPKDGDKNFSGSIFGYMSKLIVLPYSNPPASGVYWAYSTLEQTGFVPKTYAAEGIGFASLKPIMNLWIIFRDLAYLLLVLVLVTIGFMIMFRMKINPQTIISVENSLPKIATALILITFSFAIAGFLVDMMYVVMSVGISLISNNNAYYNAGDMQNKFMGGNIGAIYSSFFPIKGAWGFTQLIMMGDSIMGILPPIINNSVRLIVGGALSLAALMFVFKGVADSGIGKVLNDINILGTSLGQIPDPIIRTIVIIVVYAILGPLLIIHGAGLVVGLITWFTIVFLMFRIFFLLFRSYLQILLSIIFAPILLLLEAVPGKSSFANWFKGLAAELSGFVVVAIILSLGNVLCTSLSYPGDFWSPPFLFGIDPQAFSFILGMGLMFLIPDIMKLTKEAFGAKPLPLSIGPGTFFAGAGAAGTGGISIISQFGSMKLGLNALGIGGGTGFLGLGKAKETETSLKKPAKTVATNGGDEIQA